MRHQLIAIATGALALALVFASRPALANVTNIVLSANQTQNIACPATIQLTVNVTGSPNQPFTAELLGKFDGTVKTLIGPVTGTIPASGVAIGNPNAAIPALTGTGNELDFVAFQNGQLPVMKALPISCLPPPSVSSVKMKGSLEHLSCPAVASASADVSGTPGQTFVATLSAHFGSKTTDLPSTTFVMPASGVMNVPFDLKVPQLHDSTSFAGLSVQLAGSNAAPVAGTLKVGCDPITLTQVTVDQHTNGAWRPDPDEHYSNEFFSVSVKVRFPGSAPIPDGATCGFEADLINPIAGVNEKASAREIFKTTKSSDGGANYETYDVGFDSAKTPPGVYSIVVKPLNDPSGPPACAGSSVAAIAGMRPPTAWITGLDLYGIPFHFGYGEDNGLPQFCSNCNTVYSPSHASAFLEIVPHTTGATQDGYPWHGKCVYNVAFYGGSLSGNNNFHLGQQLEQTYTNGQPLFPPGEEFHGQPGAMGGTVTNPWWSQWDHSTNTAQVVISVASDANVPSCNILGDQNVISKTITFTSNLNLPMVHVK